VRAWEEGVGEGGGSAEAGARGGDVVNCGQEEGGAGFGD